MALPALADEEIFIANASFETPDLAPGRFTSNLVPGWVGTHTDFISNFGVFHPEPENFTQPVPQGRNVVFIERGGIHQTLTNRLQAGIVYTLSVQAGNSVFDRSSPFSVQLRAGGALLAEEVRPAVPRGIFDGVSVVFSAPADHPALGLPLEIWLLEQDLRKSNEVYFDNVRLTAVSTVRLQIECLNGTHVVLSWPATAADFRLQSSPVLGEGADWVPVESEVAIVNGRCVTTNELNSTKLYYRLQKP
ncbi:MAG TPA: hypothetical protein VNO52_14285 [Methylomirabilota bacterium]|nr:hypothetical protein [Methylomirabilota bacterium]